MKLDFTKPLSSNRKKRVDTNKADIFWMIILVGLLATVFYILGGP